MRRNVRKRKDNDDELTIKIIKYAGVAVTILTLVVIGLLIYSKSLNDDVKDGLLTEEQISSILRNTNEEYEKNEMENEDILSTGTEIGKSVNEASEDVLNVVIENKENIDNEEVSTQNNNVNNVLTTENIIPTTSDNVNNKEKKEEKEEKKTEEKIELKFEKPVEGEIVRDFASENLIYSETLDEWTTHNGIDIKAPKTTVIKTAEAGTVKTIKNDPRYGLTVIVEHEGGFQTVYSNLLTSEFVVEGEKLEKGQAIGTVGNTAAFEIADEAHLHFEILKDGKAVDPNIYLK